MNIYTELGDLIGMSASQVEKEIDEEMIPILINLNRKGYKTRFCCQGHTKDSGTVNIYISFVDKYSFTIEPPFFNKRTKIWIRKPHSLFGCGIALYYNTNKNGSFEKRENERKEIMDALLEWSKNL